MMSKQQTEPGWEAERENPLRNSSADRSPASPEQDTTSEREQARKDLTEFNAVRVMRPKNQQNQDLSTFSNRSKSGGGSGWSRKWSSFGAAASRWGASAAASVGKAAAAAKAEISKIDTDAIGASMANTAALVGESVKASASQLSQIDVAVESKRALDAARISAVRASAQAHAAASSLAATRLGRHLNLDNAEWRAMYSDMRKTEDGLLGLRKCAENLQARIDGLCQCTSELSSVVLDVCGGSRNTSLSKDVMHFRMLMNDLTDGSSCTARGQLNSLLETRVFSPISSSLASIQEMRQQLLDFDLARTEEKQLQREVDIMAQGGVKFMGTARDFAEHDRLAVKTAELSNDAIGGDEHAALTCDTSLNILDNTGGSAFGSDSSGTRGTNMANCRGGSFTVGQVAAKREELARASAMLENRRRDIDIMLFRVHKTRDTMLSRPFFGLKACQLQFFRSCAALIQDCYPDNLPALRNPMFGPAPEPAADMTVYGSATAAGGTTNPLSQSMAIDSRNGSSDGPKKLLPKSDRILALEKKKREEEAAAGEEAAIATADSLLDFGDGSSGGVPLKTICDDDEESSAASNLLGDPIFNIEQQQGEHEQRLSSSPNFFSAGLFEPNDSAQDLFQGASATEPPEAPITTDASTFNPYNSVGPPPGEDDPASAPLSDEL